MYALIRLEDIGPGGSYESADDQAKLLAVADYLSAMKVPFHAAVIPRFINPERHYDCSMAGTDPISVRFRQMLIDLQKRGASLGIHGYTHQYGNAISGVGYEFYYPGCQQDCPQDDPAEALSSWATIERTYAYNRYQLASKEFQASGIQPEWFETPHYTASDTQRKILEACSCLMYETNPDQPSSRQLSWRSSQSLIGKTYYVPTPLGYIGGDSIDQDIQKMISEAASYGEQDLASFFYHPYLEFDYIQLQQDAPPAYKDNTPLKRIIQQLLDMQRQFVTVKDVMRLNVSLVPQVFT
ncbi:DUF2334 domain-containing protein [Paenibacillus hexagrammi]|uniref:DUF2334 domain-containing protein n=1 Tax=Paenibacillus hexagrammi TaxID=2908839 RepID=A0ABY3SP63_9BACL|nr:DUF2334 domain-containing protein [Paenibacillus sp. YPD9-1]UJF34930.1 DUF2334 domain-containing protein [Paenibacillus sp. YPD9-1]